MEIKKENINKTMKVGVISAVIELLVFVMAFFSSVFLLGSDYKFGIKGLANRLKNSGEQEMAIASYIEENNADKWETISSNHTSSRPFINCASRFVETSIDKKEITVFDVPECDNAHYSYNHIYGYDVWPKMESGRIVLSKDLYVSTKSSIGDSISIKLGEETKVFTVIGYCEGSKESDRTKMGNVMADFLGDFAVVMREDLDDVVVSGYMKTVSLNQETRSFELAIRDWTADKNVNPKTSKFSNYEIQNIFGFYSSVNSKKVFLIPIGIALLLLSAVLLLYFQLSFYKCNKLGNIGLLVITISSILIWFLASFIFSKIKFKLFGYSVVLSTTGAFVLPTILLLSFCLFYIVRLLLLEKEIINKHNIENSENLQEEKENENNMDNESLCDESK